MKKSQVKIGETYAVKVSGVIQPVKVIEEFPRGGWVGINRRTGREVRIKTAGRLRYALRPEIIQAGVFGEAR